MLSEGKRLQEERTIHIDDTILQLNSDRLERGDIGNYFVETHRDKDNDRDMIGDEIKHVHEFTMNFRHHNFASNFRVLEKIAQS